MTYVHVIDLDGPTWSVLKRIRHRFFLDGLNCGVVILQQYCIVIFIVL